VCGLSVQCPLPYGLFLEISGVWGITFTHVVSLSSINVIVSVVIWSFSESSQISNRQGHCIWSLSHVIVSLFIVFGHSLSSLSLVIVFGHSLSSLSLVTCLYSLSHVIVSSFRPIRRSLASRREMHASLGQVGTGTVFFPEFIRSQLRKL